MTHQSSNWSSRSSLGLTFVACPVEIMVTGIRDRHTDDDSQLIVSRYQFNRKLCCSMSDANKVSVSVFVEQWPNNG